MEFEKYFSKGLDSIAAEIRNNMQLFGLFVVVNDEEVDQTGEQKGLDVLSSNSASVRKTVPPPKVTIVST